MEWVKGSEAVSLNILLGYVLMAIRQRIANPPSPVRIREGPLLLFPRRTRGNPGFAGVFIFPLDWSYCLSLSLIICQSSRVRAKVWAKVFLLSLGASGGQRLPFIRGQDHVGEGVDGGGQIVQGGMSVPP